MLLSLFKLLSRLPLGVLQALGGLLGRIVYCSSPTYRCRLRDNLGQAGLDVDALALPAAAEAGKQMLETAWIWLRPGPDLACKVQWVDEALLRSALAEGRPLLFLTPHLGSFEAIAQAYPLRPDAPGRPMTALYRRPRKAVLAPLLEARARAGLLLAPADMRGVRMLMRALKLKQVAGVLPDQVPAAGEGVWVPFFGRPAFTMVLPARLALGADAIVLMFAAERLPAGRGFNLHIDRLDAFTGDPVADATAINRAVERMVLRFPMQYLWGYNRYKKPANAPQPPSVAAERSGTA